MAQAAARRGAVPHPALRFLADVLHTLDRAPSWPYQIFFRIGLAFLFGYSGWNKLTGWPTTLRLFRDVYQVPLLPPGTAAVLATAIEITLPFLFLLGLCTRLAAAAAFGMTLVIQLFVLPKGYHVHALWLGPILYLLLRGPGLLSLDHVIRGRVLEGR